MFQDERPIVILGMQRSGTSAVAGSLAHLGVCLGSESDFFPADANNSEGYFEQRSMTAMCQKALSFYQMHAGASRCLPANWQAYPQADLLVKELGALLVRNFEDRPLWGFKQPLAGILYPLFRAVFEELGLRPQIVICVRNPLEIRESEAGWVYGSGIRQMAPLGSRAVGIWLNSMIGALKLADPLQHSFAVYSRFIEDPRATLREIVANRRGWSPTSEQWSSSIASVQPKLKRIHAGEDSLLPLADRLLRWCEDSNREKSTLEQIVCEFESWQAILAPEGLSGTRIGLAWHEGAEIKSAEQPFLPTGDWQRLRFEVIAPPRTILNGLLYNQPCRVWIRRCAFISRSGETPASIYPGPGSQLSELNGIRRLDGAYEPRQISLVTPDGAGPYLLELDILLESGLGIINDAAGRLSERLHRSEAQRIGMERSGGRPR